MTPFHVFSTHDATVAPPRVLKACREPASALSHCCQPPRISIFPDSATSKSESVGRSSDEVHTDSPTIASARQFHTLRRDKYTCTVYISASRPTAISWHLPYHPQPKRNKHTHTQTDTHSPDGPSLSK